MKHVKKSAKLANVCYDIRGPVLQKAKQMEEEGHKIIKLNIGNLAAFGFDSPEEIQQDMIRNLPNAAGYTDSKGIFAARKAIMHYTQQKGIKGVTLEDIYVGNGVSGLRTQVPCFKNRRNIFCHPVNFHRTAIHQHYHHIFVGFVNFLQQFLLKSFQ